MPALNTLASASARAFGFGAGGFQFDPAKAGPNVVLTNGRSTAGINAAGYNSVLGVKPMLTTQTFILAFIFGGGGGPAIGFGNASTVLSNYLGSTNDSLALFPNGNILKSGVAVGTSGFTFANGDSISMQITATQVSFAKNGGAYSTPFTHGVTGTLYPGATLLAVGDLATGMIR